MAFLVGPRQVGKTWLSKEVMKKYKNPVHLSYDEIIKDREVIKRTSWAKDADLVVFDELHKMKNWKNHLKGVSDTRKEHLHTFVTGSARLDIFRKAGDSLAGRYFAHHLFPFSVKELSGQTKPRASTMDRLLERSGFQEPFLTKNEKDAPRWEISTPTP